MVWDVFHDIGMEERKQTRRWMIVYRDNRKEEKNEKGAYEACQARCCPWVSEPFRFVSPDCEEMTWQILVAISNVEPIQRPSHRWFRHGRWQFTPRVGLPAGSFALGYPGYPCFVFHS